MNTKPQTYGLKKQEVKQIQSNYEVIETTLDGFLKNNKIPNILFHGEYGSGKKRILKHFLDKIYSEIPNEERKNYCMYINCSQGKGIDFIREELKFFARTNIHNNQQTHSLFKSIILLNADKLTINAQSALRRCIELFSMNTRFFIVIENKQKLLKPILSRFCEIHVPKPFLHSTPLNLYTLQHIKMNASFDTYKQKILEKVLETLDTYVEKNNYGKYEPTREKELIYLALDCYEKGLSALDCISYLEKSMKSTDKQKYGLLMHFQKIKGEFRNEKLLMFHIFEFYIMRNSINLENICKM